MAAEHGHGGSAGPVGAPEDVAQAAMFLANDSAAWITGVTLDLAGGYVIN